VLPGSRPASPARRPRVALVIGAVVGSVVLGGCAAGQVAQTAYQANNGGGADVSANGILVRAAQITFGGNPEGAAVYPRGGSAPVQMRIINQTSQDDRLVSASSPVAASVQISGQTDLPAGVVMVVGGETATAGQTLPGASEPPPEPPLGATLAPVSPGATAPPASSAQEPPDVAPTGAANPSGEAPAVGLQPPPGVQAIEPSNRYAQVVLTGLNDDIQSGLSYEIDLTFEKAGTVRVMRPVAYPGVPRPPAEKAE
jgi:copper(I)-binding protein